MTSKLKVNIIADGGDNNLITSDGSGSVTLGTAFPAVGKIGQVLKMLSPKLADLADKNVDDQTEDMEKEPDLGSEDPMDSESEAKPAMDAETAAAEVKAEETPQEAPAEEGDEEEDDEPEGDIKDGASEPKKEDEVLDALNQLEDLLSGILKDDDKDEDESEVDSEQYKS